MPGALSARLPAASDRRRPAGSRARRAGAAAVLLLAVAAMPAAAAAQGNLALTQLALQPSVAAPDQGAVATVRVSNTGAAPTPPVSGSLHLATATGAIADGAPLATFEVSALAAPGSATITVPFAVPRVAPGPYRVVALVDAAAAISESNETDNGASARLQVALPDLALSRVSLKPALAAPGGQVTATVAVRSAGRVTAPATRVGLYLTTQPTAPLDGLVPLATVDLPALASRQSVSKSVSLPLPVVAPGTYQVVAVVDADPLAMAPAIAGPRKAAPLKIVLPDLTVSGLSVTPSQARAGATLDLTVTVRNAGVVPTKASSVAVSLAHSPDAEPVEATPLTTLAVPALGAGAALQLTARVPVPGVEPGGYQILAIADPAGAVAEASETNNRAVTRLAVTDGGAGLTVWVVDSLTRVQPTDPPGSVTHANIKAARNEYEAFQLVIRAPDDQPLTNVNVIASDLVGPGIIPARHVTLYREHYIRVTTPSPGSPYPPGWWPDALIPFVHPETGQPLGGRFAAAPFTVPAGRNQPVWVEVFIPIGTPAGTYAGQLTVTADGGQPTTVAVSLTVWNFTLPTRPSLRTWFGSLDVSNAATAGRYLDALLRHRVTPLEPGLADPVVRDDGSIDTTQSHAALSDFLERATTWTIPFWPPHYPFHDPLGADRTRTQRYLYEVQEYLRAHGWLERAVLYLYDEPDDPEKAQAAQEYGLLVRDAAPDLQTLVTTPIRSDLYGLVTLWVPPFDRYDVTLARDRQARGEHVWTYTAVVRGPEYPTWQLDYPLFHYRIPGWINWSVDATGLLYWATNYWAESNDPWTDPSTYGALNGDGALLYPGRDVGYDGPVVSLRLKAIRDGIEDYEYLRLLSILGGRPAADGLAHDVATSFTEWSREPRTILLARELLAGRIETLLR